MSQENVEIAQRSVDALNRRDVATLAALSTSDFEWIAAMGAIEGDRSFRGREGIETYFGSLTDAWEEYRLVADEFRDLGARVLVLGLVKGRGKGSGVPVDALFGTIIDFRGDKISRNHSFLDHGEALRAAGLTE